MLRLWQSVYNTYKGDRERHRLRLIVCLVAALAIACLSKNLSDSALEMMSVAVSILTGFTFTALFSSYSSTTADLPSPKDETDRQNLVTLKQLEINFRARAKFLILATMVSLIAMVLLSIEIQPKEVVRWLAFSVSKPDPGQFDAIYLWATSLWRIGTIIVKAATVFVFLESLYTFYRLSETVVAALTLRGEYRDSHSD